MFVPATSTVATPTKSAIPPSETPAFTATQLPPSSPTIPATATPNETPKPTRTPVPTPDLTGFGLMGGGMIAFTSDRDGDNEIYLLAFPGVFGDSLVEVQLTHNEADDVVSEWSPDGTKLAFSSTRDGNYDIYILEVEAAPQNEGDRQPQRLTDHEGDDMLPTWSPDGTQIAFSSDRDGDWDIYLMDLPNGTDSGGANIRQLTENTITDSKPSWSPDGSKIAFDSGVGYNRDVYVMDINGADQTLVVEAEGGWPDWSPDGTQIAYFGRGSGNPEIYVVNTDGSHQARMTFNNIDDWEPSWSPDGEWLLYNAGPMNDIFVMRVDKSETYQLTSSNSLDWLPVWRP